jgi:hypothetical protein
VYNCVHVGWLYNAAVHEVAPMRATIRPTQRAAMQIALKTGLLKQCTSHWVYFKTLNADAMEHAFRLGNYLISRFARSVKCFKGDRKLLAETIVKCCDNAPTCCPKCAGRHVSRNLATG